jgi:hypothetical protein
MEGDMNLASLSGIAGLAAGVSVTLALRFSPKWNAPIVEQGEPITELPGAMRIGDHALRQRHREVAGPRISARAQAMPAGLLRDLVAGFGAGATAAPGATYRLEVMIEDQLQRFFPRA